MREIATRRVPPRVSTPEDVEVENADLSVELDRLSYFLEKKKE